MHWTKSPLINEESHAKEFLQPSSAVIVIRNMISQSKAIALEAIIIHQAVSIKCNPSFGTLEHT